MNMSDLNTIKNALIKAWEFLWKNDSPWSWVANILVAFIVIKYIFYPVLGLLFATSFPMVAVVSGSMEHMIVDNGGGPDLCGKQFEAVDYFMNLDSYWNHCGSWYDERGITQDQFETFMFPNGFNKGDIIIIYGQDTKNLKIGDVIVFQSTARIEPIIHRIIQIENGEFTTKGDHNPIVGPIDQGITEKTILGKGVFRIPYLGWIKIWFVDLIMLIRGM